MSRLLFSDLPADQVALLGHSHDPLLVVLSYLIASAAAFTALALAKRVSRSSSPRGRELWRWVGAFALGGGIWSMHFIGMLAFRAPLDIRYEHGITALSLLIAVAVSYVVMRVLGRDRLSVAQYALAGTAAGIGIAAMHYTGMAAIRSLATLYYAPLAFAASVLIAIGASIAALVMGFHFSSSQSRHQRWQRLLCSLVMGAAIVSMHYTGMHALTLAVPAGLVEHAAPFGSHTGQGALASAIGLVALLVIVTGIAASWAEQRFSEQRQALDLAEHQLNAMTHYDPLTNLFNGRAFTEMVTQVLAVRAERQALAVLVVDLDNFKRINDSLGHEIGDKLLVQIGDRLGRLMPEHALLSRSGGDEFMLLLDGSDHARAEQLAQCIIEGFQPPVRIGQYECYVSPSIGVAISDGRHSASDLLRQVDLALYSAKDAGRNCTVVYNESLSEAAAQRHELEQALRRALDHDEFVLHYQPQVNAQGEPEVMEALLRWASPERGLVPPGVFIPVLEDSGLIIEATRWVFREACRQACRWHAMGHALRIAVNLSPLDFRQADLAGSLLAILEEEGASASMLELEVTESALLEADEHVQQTLGRLKAAGLPLLLDDFGTGYASLTYLQRFRFDGIKIDREFVSGLPDSEQSVALVRGILTMASHLGLHVVAEGVENERQAAFLRLNGCPSLQGFHYARPLPAAQCRLQHGNRPITLQLPLDG